MKSTGCAAWIGAMVVAGVAGVSWAQGLAKGGPIMASASVAPAALMQAWIAEDNPGMQTSLGEYNFGGGKDVSGGVAQTEALSIFAREGLDYAFLWLFPEKNNPQYFAFKPSAPCFRRILALSPTGS